MKITDSAENSWVVDMISSKYMLKLMIRMIISWYIMKVNNKKIAILKRKIAKVHVI